MEIKSDSFQSNKTHHIRWSSCYCAQACIKLRSGLLPLVQEQIIFGISWLNQPGSTSANYDHPIVPHGIRLAGITTQMKKPSHWNFNYNHIHGQNRTVIFIFIYICGRWDETKALCNLTHSKIELGSKHNGSFDVAGWHLKTWLIELCLWYLAGWVYNNAQWECDNTHHSACWHLAWQSSMSQQN